MELLSVLGNNVVGVILGVILFLLCLMNYFGKENNISRLPPGPSCIPFFGNIFQVDMKQPYKTYLKLREKYGSVFTVWLGPKPVVILSGYQTLKEALVDQGEEFGGRASYPILLEVTKGYGPLASSGARWRDMRRFSISTLKNFGMGRKSIEERVQEEARSLVDAFKDIGDSAFNPNNLLCNAVSNVICSIVFGKRFEYNDPQFKFLQHGLEGYFRFLSSSKGQLFNLFPKLVWCLPGPHHKLFQHLQRTRDYFRQEAEIRAGTFDANCPRDYIESFLVQMQEQRDKPGTEFHYDNLISSIWTLFSAGTETTTSTLRHSLLMMMKYPHIQGAWSLKSLLDSVYKISVSHLTQLFVCTYRLGFA